MEASHCPGFARICHHLRPFRSNLIAMQEYHPAMVLLANCIAFDPEFVPEEEIAGFLDEEQEILAREPSAHLGFLCVSLIARWPDRASDLVAAVCVGFLASLDAVVLKYGLTMMDALAVVPDEVRDAAEARLEECLAQQDPGFLEVFLRAVARIDYLPPLAAYGVLDIARRVSVADVVLQAAEVFTSQDWAAFVAVPILRDMPYGGRVGWLSAINTQGVARVPDELLASLAEAEVECLAEGGVATALFRLVVRAERVVLPILMREIEAIERIAEETSADGEVAGLYALLAAIDHPPST
jgi:hypothetical protein